MVILIVLKRALVLREPKIISDIAASKKKFVTDMHRSHKITAGTTEINIASSKQTVTEHPDDIQYVYDPQCQYYSSRLQQQISWRSKDHSMLAASTQRTATLTPDIKGQKRA